MSAEINKREFIEAACIVATVLADRLWNASRTPEPVNRSLTEPAKAKTLAEACKHVGMGRTKFRDLVKAGAIAKPLMNGRRPTWLIKDLDRYLSEQAKLRL